MDIMYVGNVAVLHVVDKGKHLSAAKFPRDISENTICTALFECWATIYTEIKNRIRVDAGKNFAEKFIDIAKVSEIMVEPSGIEAHSSLGIGDRYHQPLRNTFRKMKLDFPNAGDTMLRAKSVQAINDTLCREVCVSSTLVFVLYPSLNIYRKGMNPNATLEVRTRAAGTARK